MIAFIEITTCLIGLSAPGVVDSRLSNDPEPRRTVALDRLVGREHRQLLDSRLGDLDPAERIPMQQG